MPPLQAKTAADIFTDTTTSPPESPDCAGSLKTLVTGKPSLMMMAVPPRPRTSSSSSSASPAPSPAASPRIVARKKPVRRMSVGSSSSSSIRARSNSYTNALPVDSVKELEKEIKRSIRDYGEHHPHTAQLHNQLGNVYFRQGLLDDAATQYKLAVQCDPGAHLSAAYLNLGTVYWRSGDIPEAIHFLQQALAVHEVDMAQQGNDLNQSTTAASVYHQLGVCYALKSDWKNALENLEKARAIRIKVMGPIDVAVGQTNDAIGKVLCMQGKYDQAMACHQQALSALKAAGATDTASTLQNIANVHMAAGHPTAALTVLQEVYKQQKEAGIESMAKAALHVQTLQMMAKLSEELRSPDEAERFRQEAESVQKQADLS